MREVQWDGMYLESICPFADNSSPLRSGSCCKAHLESLGPE